MKKNFTILVLFSFLFIGTIQSYAQLPDTWTPKSNFGGSERYGAVGFSIGTKGYMGTGWAGARTKDFWEYDPASDTWTQKADFAGKARVFASGFSIGTKGYVGCGDDSTITKDFFEFDPSANNWTQKADFAGIARKGAVGLSILGKGYIGTGLIDDSTTRVNDFWEYDPITDTWTQKADVGGNVRAYAAGFSIGSKGYIGTGRDQTTFVNDFWEYDPSMGSNGTWTQKADFGGAIRYGAIGMNIGAYGYIGTGAITLGGLTNDFWEYNPGTDNWTQKADFSGAPRFLAAAFSIENKGYIGTGQLIATPPYVNTNDFREYTSYCTLPVIISEPVNQSITYGDSAIFVVSTSDTVTYQWQEDAGSGFVDINNGGIYSNVTNDTLSISLPTADMTGYKYRCVLTNNCLLTATTDGNATLTITPQPLGITAEDKEKCYDGTTFSGGYSVLFSGFVNSEDQIVLGGTLVFSGTSDTATISGSYSIVPSGLTSTNYAISFVNGTLIIKPTPNASVITRSSDSLISSVVTGNQWYLNGTEITGSTGDLHVATVNGNYYTVVTQDGCSSAPSNTIAVVDVSIKEVGSEIFDIYPNPSNGKFNIKLKTVGTSLYTIEVYNSLGALIMKQYNAIVDGNNIRKIDLNAPKSGLYTVVLRSKANSFMKKVYITK